MESDSYREDFWRYETDKLLLTEQFAKRARIVAVLCSALPLPFSLITLIGGNTQLSVNFTITAVTFLLIASGLSWTADRYFKTIRARLERDREHRPSSDNSQALPAPRGNI